MNTLSKYDKLMYNNALVALAVKEGDNLIRSFLTKGMIIKDGAMQKKLVSKVQKLKKA